MRVGEVNQVERATLLTQRILDGDELTTSEAADLCGVSWWTADRDLSMMSRQMAIYKDSGGVWRLLERTNGNGDDDESNN